MYNVQNNYDRYFANILDIIISPRKMKASQPHLFERLLMHRQRKHLEERTIWTLLHAWAFRCPGSLWWRDRMPPFLFVYMLKPHLPRGLAACSWLVCVPHFYPCHCWLPHTLSQPPPAASALRSPGESFYTAPDHCPAAKTQNQRKE